MDPVGDEQNSADDDSKTARAYCVKCQQKTRMQDPDEIQMKNGCPALKGQCPECGTGVYKILSSRR